MAEQTSFRPAWLVGYKLSFGFCLRFGIGRPAWALRPRRRNAPYHHKKKRQGREISLKFQQCNARKAG
jgi:hypothetical protein